MTAVVVDGLRHCFGDQPVLAGVSFDVPDGSFVSVVGPSGGGKSTVLKILAGLLVPDAGTALIHGRSTVGSVGQAVLMPQRDQLMPWKRVLDNAVLGATIRGLPKADARAQARALLSRFGLAGYERAWPSQLSGGMRQRLALLRTFLAGSDVLLLDEPFSALDAITRRDLQAWFEQVWRSDRRTVLMVTHDVDEALRLSDRVVVLSARPARTLMVLECPFERPRTDETAVHPDVLAARLRVLHLLEHQR